MKRESHMKWSEGLTLLNAEQAGDASFDEAMGYVIECMDEAVSFGHARCVIDIEESISKRVEDALLEKGYTVVRGRKFDNQYYYSDSGKTGKIFVELRISWGANTPWPEDTRKTRSRCVEP